VTVSVYAAREGAIAHVGRERALNAGAHPVHGDLQGVHDCKNLPLPAPLREETMDETGMTDADKVGHVEEVLLTWGTEAAQELADRYEVKLDALEREREGSDPQRGS
jgi:hypothetical protein